MQVTFNGEAGSDLDGADLGDWRGFIVLLNLL